jgi:hypothetical protein
MAMDGSHRNLGDPNGFLETGYSPTIRKGEGAEMTVRESDRFIVEV